jgi:flagellar hook protein FlgE
LPLLSSLPPSATTTMSLDANLNASAAVGDTFSTPVQVVDSLGNTQTVTVTFTNTAANAWSYTATIPGQDVTGGKTGTPASLGTGTLAFNSSGDLTTPAAPGSVTLTNAAALADGAATLNINWNLYDSSGNSTLTQFAQTSASSGTTQNGTQPATVTGVSLQNGGLLVATYSNGIQTTLAQVAVASVSNPGTLIANSGNTYSLGADTLTPSVGGAGTGGRGTIVGGALEASNVDMAAEFTNLIVYQQGYEANSKVITTIDQMDQTLLAINP